jgi:hypothetical protein
MPRQLRRQLEDAASVSPRVRVLAMERPRHHDDARRLAIDAWRRTLFDLINEWPMLRRPAHLLVQRRRREVDVIRRNRGVTCPL